MSKKHAKPCANMPARITVGPFTLDVIVDELENLRDSVDVSREKVFGTCDVERGRIKLRPDMAHDFTAETLFHEVLHAAFVAFGNPLPEADEERVVGALSPILLDSLRRNPALVTYILAEAP